MNKKVNKYIYEYKYILYIYIWLVGWGMMWEIPHRCLSIEYGTVKRKKTVRHTYPVTGVEGDATTTDQEAGEPKSH